MRPGTRMMMISSLGEEGNENRRRMGFESERREMRYPESPEGYDRPEGGNGARGDYGPEGRYGQRGNGPRNNGTQNYGPQNAYGPRNAYEAEGDYRVRGRDDYERREPPMYYGRSEGGMEPWRRDEKREKGGPMEYRMEGEGRRRPMSHYGGEEDEDDMSGSFRHRKAKGHVPEEEKEELTEERVKKWVEGMQNSDGKSGSDSRWIRPNCCGQTIATSATSWNSTAQST